MQFLVFHLGQDAYGLHTASIVRVLPLLHCKQLPGAPRYVAGLVDYHGTPVPVLDLCILAGADPATACLDTRIVLVQYQAPEADSAPIAEPRLLGLIAERVSGVVHIEEHAFDRSGISSDQSAAYLGKVATSHGMLQLVEVRHLLPPPVRALLFPSEVTSC